MLIKHVIFRTEIMSWILNDSERAKSHFVHVIDFDVRGVGWVVLASLTCKDRYKHMGLGCWTAGKTFNNFFFFFKLG